MILLGCKPEGRNTEQHDIFFGIGADLASLQEEMINFWPEARGRLHIDAWRIVEFVDGYRIDIVTKEKTISTQKEQLFFINLGGYKKNEFEEFHYKLLTVGEDKGSALIKAKQTAFYKHTGFKGAASHVDDKYGIDVDDAYAIEEILPSDFKEKYSVRLVKTANEGEDEWHLGYLKLDKLKELSQSSGTGS